MFGVVAEQRRQRGDDGVVVDILAIQLVQARAVERAAEIEIVDAGAATDETDLRQVRPRAAVRAAGHADGDVVLRQADSFQLVFQPRDQLRQVALAFRQREAAGRQRDTGQRIAPQSAERRVQPMLPAAVPSTSPCARPGCRRAPGSGSA